MNTLIHLFTAHTDFALSEESTLLCNPNLTSINWMMFLGPIRSGSNSKRPLLVARATDAFMTPGFLLRVDSILFTHEEQVIPEI